MDRLTMRNDDGLIIPTKLNMKYISKMPVRDWNDWTVLLNRLGDYEDVGFTPEEVLDTVGKWMLLSKAFLLCVNDMCDYFNTLAPASTTTEQLIQKYIQQAITKIENDSKE